MIDTSPELPGERAYYSKLMADESKPLSRELPPLPKPDLGSILVGREEINLGHSDEALRAYAEEAVKQEREACAVICDELQEHYAAYKDTALLNGDVELSNAASGEPRACEAVAAAIRARSGGLTPREVQG